MGVNSPRLRVACNRLSKQEVLRRQQVDSELAPDNPGLHKPSQVVRSK